MWPALNRVGGERRNAFSNIECMFWALLLKELRLEATEGVTAYLWYPTIPSEVHFLIFPLRIKDIKRDTTSEEDCARDQKEKQPDWKEKQQRRTNPRRRHCQQCDHTFFRRRLRPAGRRKERSITYLLGLVPINSWENEYGAMIKE